MMILKQESRMKDLFQPPYHQQLHEIMLRKGYIHKRIKDPDGDNTYDMYEKDGRVLTYDDGDYVIMTEADGNESDIGIFIQETDGIFDPDEREH
jgi:hypothetical protein